MWNIAWYPYIVFYLMKGRRHEHYAWNLRTAYLNMNLQFQIVNWTLDFSPTSSFHLQTMQCSWLFRFVLTWKQILVHKTIIATDTEKNTIIFICQHLGTSISMKIKLMVNSFNDSVQLLFWYQCWNLAAPCHKTIINKKPKILYYKIGLVAL